MTKTQHGRKQIHDQVVGKQGPNLTCYGLLQEKNHSSYFQLAIVYTAEIHYLSVTTAQTFEDILCFKNII